MNRALAQAAVALKAWRYTVVVRDGRSFGGCRGRGRSARVGVGVLKMRVARASHRLVVGAAAALVLSLAQGLWVAPAPAAKLGAFVQQGPKIQGFELFSQGGPGSSSGVGEDVALSADGDTAVVGTRYAQFRTGAVVLTRMGSTWSKGAHLKYTGEAPPQRGPEAGARVGWSVAISADGNTILLGGPANQYGIGGVWVFTRSGSTWSQQEVLEPSGYQQSCPPSDVGYCPCPKVEAGFGTSVALSGDANTALIGGPTDEGNTGAVWVFRRSGGVYTQQGSKLTASGGDQGFGGTVALSSDGQTALIGAPDDSGGIGAVWGFQRSGRSFEQVGGKFPNGDETANVETYPHPHPTPDSSFGRSLALSADGDTAVIGGAETAQVLRQRGMTWVQQASLSPGEATGATEFGISVAMSGDGKTALVGDPEEDEKVGAAWAFTRSGRSWTQLGPKLLGKEELRSGAESGNQGGAFGTAVALARDGNTAVIGGPFDGHLAGALWPFVGERLHP